MKKLAVFLRGHIRTWEFTKHNIFNFCDQLADQVDYYVAVWKRARGGLNEHTIREDFINKKLVAYEIVDDHLRYNAWDGPAYLSNNLSKFRLENEFYSGQRYDAVLDTRLDVAFKLLARPEAPPSYHVGTTRFDPEFVNNWKGLEDHAFFMSPAVHTIWNQRTQYHTLSTYGNENGSHSKFQHYAANYGIQPYRVPWFTARIVRPTIAFTNVKDPLYLDMNNLAIAERTWQDMTNLEKISMLEKTNIPLTDYLAALDLAY